jgi:hypothetical protein
LKPFSAVKAQGFSLCSILSALLLSRLGGLSVYAMQKTGKRIEGISRIFSHVNHSDILDFEMLVLACWDGKSLLPCDCSLHRENKKIIAV